MQQATGPNFSVAVANAASMPASSLMSQRRVRRFGLGVRIGEGARSRDVTRQEAERRAETVTEPIMPLPPVMSTCVPARLRERSIVRVWWSLARLFGGGARLWQIGAFMCHFDVAPSLCVHLPFSLECVQLPLSTTVGRRAH